MLSALSSTPKLPSEALVVGLDTDQIPARLLVAAAGDGPAPQPIEHREFSSLSEFCVYWGTHWKGEARVRVAAPRAGKDPLGILRWLDCMDAQVERYPWMAYRSHLNGDFATWDLPQAYQRAYVLTLYASYRTRTAQVVRGAWARLLEMQELFDLVQTDLHRLAAALDLSPEPADCPF